VNAEQALYEALRSQALSHGILHFLLVRRATRQKWAIKRHGCADSCAAIVAGFHPDKPQNVAGQRQERVSKMGFG
jgi:hypothetical protein